MQYSLYKKTVNLQFNEAKHLYTIDGNKVSGVTSILQVRNKPAIFYWGINMAVDYMRRRIKPGKSYDELQIKEILESAKWAHKKKRDTAADIGVFVHKWCEDYIKQDEVMPEMPVNEKIKNGVEAFLKWKAHNKVTFLGSEKVLYSKEYNYAGTMDFVATVNGELLVGDFKTSSGIYPEMFFQTAAYQAALSEEYPKNKYVGNLILRLGKDGEFEVQISRDYEKNINAFYGALALYTRLEELKQEYYDKKNNY